MYCVNPTWVHWYKVLEWLNNMGIHYKRERSLIHLHWILQNDPTCHQLPFFQSSLISVTFHKFISRKERPLSILSSARFFAHGWNLPLGNKAHMWSKGEVSYYHTLKMVFLTEQFYAWLLRHKLHWKWSKISAIVDTVWAWKKMICIGFLYDDPQYPTIPLFNTPPNTHPFSIYFRIGWEHSLILLFCLRFIFGLFFSLTCGSGDIWVTY